MAAGLALLALASCSKDTEGLTGITYYPVIELAGPIYDQAVAGTPFSDPGFSAVLNGEDYTANVEIVTNMNLSNPQPGYYAINYVATNADGFSTSATRYVLVSENSDKVSGYYTVNPGSFRDYNGTIFYGNYPEIVYANGDGTYHVSDLMGGWYQYRAGYGVNYAMSGDISIDADGNISLISSIVPGWGDEANYLADGKFDAEAGTISYVVSYTDYPFLFNVILDKD